MANDDKRDVSTGEWVIIILLLIIILIESIFTSIILFYPDKAARLIVKIMDRNKPMA